MSRSTEGCVQPLIPACLRRKNGEGVPGFESESADVNVFSIATCSPNRKVSPKLRFVSSGQSFRWAVIIICDPAHVSGSCPGLKWSDW